MLSLPDKYKKDSSIPKNVFVKGAELAGADKKRFETSVESIHLKYQIEGFDIPNLVNDEYNCQVIMFIAIHIKELKQASFIAKIVQKCLPTLCVIEFTDGTDEVYSFADKRLNKLNEKEIVIENEYISTKLPLNYDNDLKTLFSLYIDYETILNRNNKHAYYVEMMTKAFLVCERGAYSQSDSILDNKKLWYDEERASQVFPLMKQIKTLKETAAKAKSIEDRSEYNKKIRQTISELERLMHNE